ncbi:ParB N-terminal domain-containing protein [Streptomyces sp. NPDC090052]|uniref:ParB/RepB/Spo0J family partition protein n=1 Tax=unclassified Streptomyces TaxID=2593676 RepID=UPI00224FD952|nr:ParB N-terminal domain-containing protein [Streptomyces sp. NBC_01306]MCX4724071.1 ParB N-terminal domain-containing protein [Streptomyces sp. NBC_01306]WSV06384.1 ParB N-terminal domain-containing protein [Streptomyces sp. NBC_01020]WSX44511.1 ParB N-terminal domain-containing protein [Streptomyces sp. NBC_00963]WSX67481.1 ParB N-terminal domain-containing protein [Streptomyces sp. NBC_00932]
MNAQPVVGAVEKSDGGESVPSAALTRLPLTDILQPDSPRLSGLNDEHARLLANSDAALPPILVNRCTMRVVDGAHRLLAAKLRGQESIDVDFCECDNDEAFVLAVEKNATHGLPLSRAERTAATERILGAYPEWSDRAVAAVVGLSHKTVGSIRRRFSKDSEPVTHRRGRDGRLRPVNGAAARARVSSLLADRQGASLREIAREAGVSPDTVRNVRDDSRRAETLTAPEPRSVPDADHERQEAPKRTSACVRIQPSGPADRSMLVRSLRSDPSLRFSESGRILLRLLDLYALDPDDWARISGDLPAHRASDIAQLARECGRIWQNFAAAVEQRQRQAVEA